MLQNEDASSKQLDTSQSLDTEEEVPPDGSLSNLFVSAVGAVARPVSKRLMRPMQHAAQVAADPVIEQTVVVVEGVLKHPAIQMLIENQVNVVIERLTNSARVAALIEAQVITFLQHLETNPQLLDRLVATVAGRYLQVLAEDPSQLDGLVRGVAGKYIASLAENPDPAMDELVQNVAGNYLTYLRSQPEMLEPLVQEIAGGYMAYLREHPEQVDGLVTVVGDNYIKYLNQQPEMIQNLLSGQSTSLATEVMEEVRERTVSGDNALEALVRSLIRLKPRESLPPPPPEVMERAEGKTVKSHPPRDASW